MIERQNNNMKRQKHESMRKQEITLHLLHPTPPFVNKKHFNVKLQVQNVLCEAAMGRP